MTYKTKAFSYDARVHTFWALIAVCVLALAIYILCVHLTIRNTAARQALEGELARLSAEQSSLEFAYIEMRNKVTMEVAYERGFKEVELPTYLSRARAGTLVLNTAGR